MWLDKVTYVIRWPRDLGSGMSAAEDTTTSTFTGRLSMRMPFTTLKALLALSAWWKVMWAMPRLTPPGPYDSSTLFTCPTDCWK